MVERAPGARGRRLGLDRDQSLRRRRAHGVSRARKGRRQLLGGRRRAGRRQPRAHPEAGRSPVRAAQALALAAHRRGVSGLGARERRRSDHGARAADGRPGARRPRQDRHHLLGRRGASTTGRAVDYMHVEALEALPELLGKLGIAEPILVGHSDGGSIALLYAAVRDGVTGLVLMAPHVFVEDISVKSIAAAKTAFESTDLPQKLGRHHADAAKTFRGWNDIWLNPDFRGWSIEEHLPRVYCPVLAIQGFDDEYGTMAQLEAVAKRAGGPVELLRLADCRHSPHRDQPGVVLEAMARFIGRLGEGA